MTFQDFLNKSKSVTEATKRVVVGERFKDEKGDDYSFEIKAISGEKLEAIRANFRKIDKSGKFKFDEFGFNTKIAVECTVYPNFKDAESIKSRGKHTPEEYIQDILKPGEIEVLSDAVKEFSGYGTSFRELVDEAKN